METTLFKKQKESGFYFIHKKSLGRKYYHYINFYNGGNRDEKLSLHCSDVLLFQYDEL